MRFELSEPTGMTELSSTHEYDSLASQEISIIFKHSPTCPTSLWAHREVSRFCQKQPEAPVYLISVRRQRDVARHVAERTGVRHESPQVVVLHRGGVLASASHDAITAEWIASTISPHSVSQ